MSGTVQPPGAGGRLREHRRRAGMTQQELAARSGLSLRAIRDVENGRAHPRPATVRRLAETLGLTAAEHEALAPPASTGPVQVEILGPLRARRGGAAVELGPPLHRTLLALLALRAGEPVPVADIAAAHWGTAPPRSAARQVRAAITALDRLLDGSRVTGDGGGPALAAGPHLDAARFDTLVRQADGQPAPAAAAALAAALDLWRGPVLLGGALRNHPAAAALNQRRIAAALALAALDAPAAAEPLRALARDVPLHEQVHAALMAALAELGDRAGALLAYAEITGRLADEWGAEPGDELQHTYAQVLGRAPAAAAWPLPAQLPAAVTGFVGRKDLLKRLDEDETLSLVVGSAGVGKSTLAVHWAQRERGSFPDGQLYADLRGYTPDAVAVAPETVLRGFLDALGVAPERVPARVDGQTGLLRSLLADRRVLIVLDNARDGAQLLPLLPGGPGNRTIVTSRDQLIDLTAATGVAPITVGLLSPGEARDLLARRLGAERVAGDPAAADQIAANCARLPLAISVVAARAAGRPEVPLRLVAEQLHASGHEFGAVRAAFDWSYARLDADARRLLRLSAAHPGPDFTAAGAAALAGWPVPRARAVIEDLVRAHQVSEVAPGRFGLHDLLRAYARQLLTAEEGTAAALRVLAWYEATAHRAAVLVEPHREPIGAEGAGPVPAEPADADAAMAWLAAEHPTLVAAVAQAEALGQDRQAWHLAWSLLDYLDHQGHWTDWIAVEEIALRAAVRAGDRRGEAYAHRILGRGYTQLERYAEAADHYRAAARCYADLDDAVGHAHTLMSLSWMAEMHGDHERALRQRQTALALYRRRGHGIGEARTLNAVGWAHLNLGDVAQGFALCRQALARNEQVDDGYGRGAIWDSLGVAHHRLGEHTEAVRCLRQSLAVFRSAGDRFNEADVLLHLGDAYASAGRGAAARSAWRAAWEIFDQLGHPRADEASSRLG
ncbi:BTAD domain-containing putative transcriptional regulator [Catellatospora sp. KI3]|uniref:BTAD domain-containing putative transcriptional regulator n=1 Tax=Catellatospora sp. KI3 TaxID=3041620 RepID=UPI0024832407|nr:BTAD domain-containing putative transcriptional regulator [Catellatospora sp. KI3]MDI1464054.1 BTAD domain-containing putative transcriptional regulator [Catellatospora sp. KI3]